MTTSTLRLLRRGLAAVLAAMLALPVVTTAQAVPVQADSPNAAYSQVNVATGLATTKRIAHSYGGYSSYYDLYVGNIDRSKPVGVLFYFDADTSKPGNFRYLKSDLMERIKNSAAKRNMVFIAVHTPGGKGKYGLYNWWDNREKGAYARNLADTAIARHGLDYSQVWLTGWSGGAQLITQELLAHRQTWLTGGGMIVMGGGEAEYGVSAPDPRVKSMKLRWYIGDRDGYGATVPKTWSAKVAAQRGLDSYRAAGFRDAALVTVANQGHYYDVASVIERGLAENYGVPAPKPAPKPTPKPLPPPVCPVTGDVVSIDGEGNLWNYNGHNSGLGNRTRIGWGWGGFTTHHQTDWDVDGVQDVLAVHKNGNVVVYRGRAGGGYEGQRVIGTGFVGHKVFPLKTCASCRPHLAAISPGGELYRWTNNSNWRLTDRTRIGWGWADMRVVPVDWDSDGDDDVAGIDAAGNLWLYSTERGSFEPGREKIGWGWGSFETIMAVPGLMGGNAIVAKTSRGELVSYPFERGYFPSHKREIIGRGWAYHRVAGSSAGY